MRLVGIVTYLRQVKIIPEQKHADSFLSLFSWWIIVWCTYQTDAAPFTLSTSVIFPCQGIQKYTPKCNGLPHSQNLITSLVIGLIGLWLVIASQKVLDNV